MPVFFAIVPLGAHCFWKVHLVHLVPVVALGELVALGAHCFCKAHLVPTVFAICSPQHCHAVNSLVCLLTFTPRATVHAYLYKNTQCSAAYLKYSFHRIIIAGTVT